MAPSAAVRRGAKTRAKREAWLHNLNASVTALQRMHPYAASRERGSTCWAKSLQLKPRQRAATASKLLALLNDVAAADALVQNNAPGEQRHACNQRIARTAHCKRCIAAQHAIDAR